MNIGIMTWWHWNNYGTVLQAFALNKYINERLNIKAETINWLPDYTVGEERIQDKVKKLFIRNKKNNSSNEERNEKFEEFRSQIRFSEKVSDKKIRSFLKRYDCVVYGSDQIWQPWFYKKEYWGGAVKNKVAYAPSIGSVQDFQEHPQHKMLIRKLKKFDKLSFREEEVVDYFKRELQRECEFVLDPVMLLRKNEWEKSFSESSNTLEKIMLIYVLEKEEQKNKIEYAKKIAQERGLTPVIIAPGQEHYEYENVYEEYGPIEWLNCISKAEIVFTDSFHGMVFSTIFHTPFIPLKRKVREGNIGQNSRLYAFLSLIGENENKFSEMNIKKDIEEIKKWNWNEIDRRIDVKRKISEEYLKEALKKKD